MKKKASKILIYSLIAFWVCYLLGFGLTCAVRQRFDIRYLASLDTLGFFALFVGLAVMVVLLYYYKHYWLLNSKNIIKGKQSDLHLAANLEQSRFESDEEIDKNFTTVDFDELKGKEIAGTPIKAVEADGHLRVTFAKPSHSLIIGTTGSGKTTTFVSPTIQILSELKNHPSMLISDPKGELYADHSEALKAKGYEVKVLDLRNPYNSVRWNPLERPYLLYQRALHLDDEVKEDEERGCWTFDGSRLLRKGKTRLGHPGQAAAPQRHGLRGPQRHLHRPLPGHEQGRTDVGERRQELHPGHRPRDAGGFRRPNPRDEQGEIQLLLAHESGHIDRRRLQGAA
jgi:hypothetical protein